MLLTANGVGFLYQFFEGFVQILRAFKAESQAIGTRSEFLDSLERGVGRFARKPERGIKPILSGDATGESDSCLKGDAGLLRDYRHGSARSYERQQLIENFAHGWTLVCEMTFEAVVGTGVPHITSNEPMPAFRTSPQRFLGSRHGSCPAA